MSFSLGNVIFHVTCRFTPQHPQTGTEWRQHIQQCAESQGGRAGGCSSSSLWSEERHHPPASQPCTRTPREPGQGSKSVSCRDKVVKVSAVEIS